MNSSPVFRKAILPWYDTNAACIGLLIVMTAVMLFGIEGVRVAGKTDQYTGHVWVPILLIILCSSVCMSILFRLVHRYRDRSSF